MDNQFNLQEFLAAKEVTDANPFPVEAFPVAIQQIILATKEALRFPVDFMGTSILFALGVAIGNTFLVQIMPGWVESANMYYACVGRPGTSKTHPVNFALKPIKDHDQKLYTAYKALKREYDKQMAIHKKRRNGNPPPEKPILEKHLIQDATPEAVVDVHSNNPRGIGLHMDELMGFIKNFGRYTNGSGGDQEFWLMNWSGQSIIQDRKSGDPVNLPRPFIPIIGTIQPGVLQSLSKDGRGQNGFTDRMAFTYPENLEKEYWSQKHIDPNVANKWETIILNLLERGYNIVDDQLPEPTILSYTPEAFSLLQEWQRYNTDMVNAAPTESLGGLYTKLEAFCVRISLKLQLAAWSCCEGDRDAIGVKSVEGAIRLVEYFRKTGVKVHDSIYNFNPLENLEEDKRIIYESLPMEFKTKEGIEIALDLGMPKRTFQYWLNDRTLFNRQARGKIVKLV